MLPGVSDEVLQRRFQYETEGIDVEGVDPDPLVQFDRWFVEAAVDIDEANAMVLSTVGPQGPSSRAVLLRSFREGRFVFFTNRSSRKGDDIAFDDRVALLFPWFVHHRQVRITGRASAVAEEESDAYFAGRPRDSQAGAVASPQSKPIPGREWLEQRVTEILSGPITRPEHWGGYAVAPSSFEFWQGRSGRLHDRIRYTAYGPDWKIERLAP